MEYFKMVALRAYDANTVSKCNGGGGWLIKIVK